MKPVLIDIRSLGNNFIGEIGEVLGSRLLPYAHRPKGKTREFLDAKFPFEINESTKKFLKEYWNSIDLFRFVPEEDLTELIEVKTFSKPQHIKKFPKIKLTSRTYKMYKLASKLGFRNMLLKIYFSLDWKIHFKLEELNFNECIIWDGGNFKYKSSI